MADEETTDEEPKDIETKVREALEENGLLILFRIRNNSVDYSIMNRPEPTLSGVEDHWLATAIVDAVKRFRFKRASSNPYRGEKIERVDGRNVTYKEHVDFDWTDQVIYSSKGEDLTKQVLSIVVKNLMEAAEKQQVKQQSKGGLN